MQQSTAVISIEPRRDEVVLKLAEEALRVWEYAQKLEVHTTEDVRHATEDLNLISTIKKRLEEKRKEFVQPLDEHRKSIQEKFKTITGPVGQADRVLRDKIKDFNIEQRRLQEEAARAQALIDEARRIQDDLTKQTGEVFEQLPEIEAPDAAPVQRAYTGVGSMYTRKDKKWEVVDIAQVPDEYKMIDAAKVGKVVRAGIPSIPGIRIWEEEGLAITPVRESRALQEGGDAEQAKDGDLPF